MIPQFLQFYRFERFFYTGKYFLSWKPQVFRPESKVIFYCKGKKLSFRVLEYHSHLKGQFMDFFLPEVFSPNNDTPGKFSSRNLGHQPVKTADKSTFSTAAWTCKEYKLSFFKFKVYIRKYSGI
ncbi:hypothetical protein DSECCO2_656570 [anaerobic digester metagenome]